MSQLKPLHSRPQIPNMEKTLNNWQQVDGATPRALLDYSTVFKPPCWGVAHKSSDPGSMFLGAETMNLQKKSDIHRYSQHTDSPISAYRTPSITSIKTDHQSTELSKTMASLAPPNIRTRQFL